MKIYGGEVAEGSNIKNLTVASGEDFPNTPNAAELFYRLDENKLYLYNGSQWVELSALAVSTYKHTQASASTTWIISHNLNSIDILFEIYVDIGGSDYKPILPNDFSFTNSNTITLTFSSAQSGYAIIKKI
ncbi:MAG: hypothetical protein QXG00_06835 [Candidatus Woesearchaeota archaeon]